ncbi:MAG: PHP domain-containing protein [Thermomicrobiales bacterium]
MASRDDATDPAGATVAANPIDLHTHSSASDGLLSPGDLVRTAGRRGLSILALTDHDTTDGLAEAGVAAVAVGLELIPGIELSTQIGPHDVHLLGYFVDRSDDEFQGRLAVLRDRRLTRAEKIVGRLREIGSPVDLDRVRAIAGVGAVGRPHIARAMIEAGHAASIADAFDRFLATGRPAYVPRANASPERTIAMLLRAGAVPVLAHPHSTGDIESILRTLAPLGLRGIEVFYGEYDAATRLDLLGIAERWGLIPTGGSDFHGDGFKPGRALGGPAVPSETVERLRAAAEAPPASRS